MNSFNPALFLIAYAILVAGIALAFYKVGKFFEVAGSTRPWIRWLLRIMSIALIAIGLYLLTIIFGLYFGFIRVD